MIVTAVLEMVCVQNLKLRIKHLTIEFIGMSNRISVFKMEIANSTPGVGCNFSRLIIQKHCKNTSALSITKSQVIYCRIWNKLIIGKCVLIIIVTFKMMCAQ